MNLTPSLSRQEDETGDTGKPVSPVLPHSGVPVLDDVYPSADTLRSALGFPERPNVRRPPITATRIA